VVVAAAAAAMEPEVVVVPSYDLEDHYRYSMPLPQEVVADQSPYLVEEDCNKK
jgi:hypothetical protein